MVRVMVNPVCPNVQISVTSFTSELVRNLTVQTHVKRYGHFCCFFCCCCFLSITMSTPLFPYHYVTTTFTFNRIGNTFCHITKEFLEFRLCGKLDRQGYDRWMGFLFFGIFFYIRPHIDEVVLNINIYIPLLDVQVVGLSPISFTPYKNTYVCVCVTL